ncbi:fimbrial protein [Huaxiibacter chinensis]
MKMNTFLTLTGLTALMVAASATLAADNMILTGTLRAHACSLHPDDNTINVVFGELGTRDLYLNGGTREQPFSIRLLDCNPAVANEVQITFDGQRNPFIPGSLALNSGSAASGVAIIISDANKHQLNPGTALTLPVIAGNNTLLFHRRLQVEPDALNNEGIISGNFSANATFTLFYP